MTSPETPPQAPQRSVAGDGSWKAVMPIAIVLGAFLTFLGAMITYFDNRFTVGIAGFRTELAMTEQRLTSQIAEVKADLATTEKRLSDRIDRVEQRLSGRIDEVKADLAASEAKRAAADAQQSATMERLAAGIADNRANHRELAGFVHARHLGALQPATEQPEPPPAQ